jgi:hypothetical protein
LLIAFHALKGLIPETTGHTTFTLHITARTSDNNTFEGGFFSLHLNKKLWLPLSPAFPSVYPPLVGKIIQMAIFTGNNKTGGDKANPTSLTPGFGNKSELSTWRKPLTGWTVHPVGETKSRNSVTSGQPQISKAGRRNNKVINPQILLQRERQTFPT